MKIEDRLNIARRVVEEATKVAMKYFERLDTIDFHSKHPKDFVSEADQAVEVEVRKALQIGCPNEDVLGEENGGSVGTSFWVVDPIDGTANFLRGSPLWGISLAYIKDGIPIVGVIAYPQLGYTLSAAMGTGLYIDEMQIQRGKIREAVKVASVGENIYWDLDDLGTLEKDLRKEGWGLAGYRSATIGLGFAALGHTDGYIEKHLSVWDLAAGVVLARESGLEVGYRFDTSVGGAEVFVGTKKLKSFIHALNRFTGP